MSFFTTEKPTPVDEIQSRLMRLAAFFLLFYSLAQTLAPAARLQSWDVEYRWNHWIGFVVWLIGCAVVHHQIIQRLPERDPYLFPIIALLTGWGMLAIWRLDWVMGARQTAWLVVCLAALFLGLRVPNLLDFLRRYKYLWLTCGLLLTALTFLFGTYPGGNGPRLWLGGGGLWLQPSEPLKLLLIIYLAAYLADRLPVSFSLMQLLTPTLILIGMALALLVRQRDLGTASLFILIYTIIVYLASRRWRLLVGSLLVLALAGVTGYMLFDVVRIRVDAWLNPWLDPSGRSYQIVQSLMAVSSGGFFGRGPGLGSPGVVPVAHSDFIFASITEENGLLGAVGLLALFALLVNRGIRSAMNAVSNYQRFLAAGLVAYLVMQAILIIGGNLRLLPLTGVTLPFVSYGGSSLLTAFVSGLILLLVSSRGEEDPAPLPRPDPYYLISAALLAGLFALALVTGWWAVVRSDALLARTDNPRRGINDRFVARGEILDRNNKTIVRTEGNPGEYQRVYEYPPLSTTTGYNNPLFGQAGLEADLDPYLRGLRGVPDTTLWASHFLYGQPPPGLNVRLSIDLELQQRADELLGDHAGALVLLRADTGEILAMASHPAFDPNQLEATWEQLIQDDAAPLLNRATLGQYPVGAAISPFLLAYSSAQGSVPNIPRRLVHTTENGTIACAVPPDEPVTTGDLVMNGCPGPLVALGQQLGAEELERLFRSLQFFTAPGLALPTSAPVFDEAALARIARGNAVEGITLSPLQMALAAAALTLDGSLPSPQLATAVETPEQGWVALSSPALQETLLMGGTQPTLRALQQPDRPYWQIVATTPEDGSQVTWFVAGTQPTWNGAPLALAIVLEEDNPALAESIGQNLLQAVQP